ncbi:flagellar biosynthesis protein FlhF [Alkalibacillus haloalkaliphilus]|uniref:Flagellar biosynthesis protein FlhF n=1 Tax=Alkalibacillus haloalkaliphilus TaxID=94136 RepID=A0A511W1K8_9BACI|nr:flagellar biosynthesis protein FlhF [Alkalibacillus haloalkaliphilus]GEN44936.1 flagellar biosynthesis protein FlhF [Alkalibacillus haloalkaliphilus]
MKVKKYTAPTMPEAMKKVRKELGNQAVILNSKEKRSTGFLGFLKKKNIEVVAAVDPNPIYNKQTTESKGQFSLNQDPLIRNEHTSKSKEYDSELLEEIRDLKEQLTLKQETKTQYPKVIEEVNNYLQGQGVSQSVIDELIDPLLAEYYSNGQQGDSTIYYELLQKQVTTRMEAAATQSNSSAKRIFLFGPTGVGKTTTLAKLAADASINQNKDVALITLDTYRIAAVEQLKTYAKILNLPVEVAYNKEDFEQAKDSFSHKDLILVDTAGRNFRNSEYIEQIDELIDFNEQDELYCVLSLTSKEQDMVDIYNNFKALPINQVIFTKVDETNHYGPILNLWHRYKFNISYITTGQDVPDDIEKASPNRIAQLIVGEQ